MEKYDLLTFRNYVIPSELGSANILQNIFLSLLIIKVPATQAASYHLARFSSKPTA